MKEDNRHISDELLITYLAGEQSESEAEQVETWVAASEENRRYFSEFEQTWKLVGEVKESELAMVDQAWTRFQDRVGEKARPAVIRPFWQSRAIRIAAVLLVGIACTVGIISLLNRGVSVELKQISNTSNKPLKQELADGSIIHLKPDARLSFPASFETEERRVQLEGQAFFDVARDEQHPFVIETAQTEIEVLGTSFLVKADAEATETEVIVKTGKVAVQAKESSTENRVVLEKGEAVTYLHQQEEMVEEQVSEELPDAWVPRYFSFSQTPLAEVASAFSEAFGQEVVYVSMDNTDCRLNGVYESASLDEIMMLIAASAEYEVQKTATGYIIQGNHCSR